MAKSNYDNVSREMIQYFTYKGSITEILDFCNGNGATTPSLSYKIILKLQEK